MTQNNLSIQEKYLRYIEETLFFKGGKWIANFDVAVRNFDISRLKKHNKLEGSGQNLDTLIYGGVKGKGFILSRAFAFLASPTYVVSCAAVDVQNGAKLKWSTIVSWIRDIRTLMEIMEFEWSWIVFFGDGMPSEKVKNHLEKFSQREIGLVYSDLKQNQVLNSDGFIARRGAKLFHPKNLYRKGFSLKFWKKE